MKPEDLEGASQGDIRALEALIKSQAKAKAGSSRGSYGWTNIPEQNLFRDLSNRLQGDDARRNLINFLATKGRGDGSFMNPAQPDMSFYRQKNRLNGGIDRGAQEAEKLQLEMLRQQLQQSKKASRNQPKGGGIANSVRSALGGGGGGRPQQRSYQPNYYEQERRYESDRAYQEVQRKLALDQLREALERERHAREMDNRRFQLEKMRGDQENQRLNSKDAFMRSLIAKVL